MTSDEQYMRLAIDQALQAQDLGEVPIGAVVVVGDEVVAAAGNRRELWQDPTAHAELIAIRAAAKATGSWRLEDATLYVTLEPCVMCMGAIILARIPRLVYGASDGKVGAAGSLYDFSTDERFNHSVAVEAGILADECSQLLSTFFLQLRQQKKLAKVASAD
ncbi:MAG: tRNA adenosine(34) deaminase TadA [Desulfuromonas sp.]|nr:tRNA adenosine(34) deaminase TadA [Desulfuromonas sp.]